MKEYVISVRKIEYQDYIVEANSKKDAVSVLENHFLFSDNAIPYGLPYMQDETIEADTVCTKKSFDNDMGW